MKQPPNERVGGIFRKKELNKIEARTLSETLKSSGFKNVQHEKRHINH